MKVVIDTNVLISAVLKGRKPRQLIQAIAELQAIGILMKYSQ